MRENEDEKTAWGLNGVQYNVLFLIKLHRDFF